MKEESFFEIYILIQDVKIEYTYIHREKIKDENLKKERERKRKKLQDLKANTNGGKSEKYKKHLQNDRERKAIARLKKIEVFLNTLNETKFLNQEHVKHLITHHAQGLFTICLALY